MLLLYNDSPRLVPVCVGKGKLDDHFVKFQKILTKKLMDG